MQVRIVRHARYMNNLTPDVISKTESQYVNQISLHDVTSNNTFSGLREKVILTNTYLFGAKIWWKILMLLWRGGRWRKGTVWRTIITNKVCMCPPWCIGVRPIWNKGRIWRYHCRESWHILQHLMPQVWQLVLAKVPV